MLCLLGVGGEKKWKGGEMENREGYREMRWNTVKLFELKHKVKKIQMGFKTLFFRKH